MLADVDVLAPGQEQVTYNRYDDSGNVILTVHPSAMVYLAGNEVLDGHNYAAGYYDRPAPT